MSLPTARRWSLIAIISGLAGIATLIVVDVTGWIVGNETIAQPWHGFIFVLPIVGVLGGIPINIGCRICAGQRKILEGQRQILDSLTEHERLRSRDSAMHNGGSGGPPSGNILAFELGRRTAERGHSDHGGA